MNAWRKKRMLVQYDGRGWGLSERNVTTLAGRTRAGPGAVVGQLELETFELIAALAVRGRRPSHYAAATRSGYPASFSGMLMPGRDYWDAPRHKAFRAMRESRLADLLRDPQPVFSLAGGTEIAPLIRESATPELYKAFMDATARFDVTHLLPQVRCPILVLHAPEMRHDGSRNKQRPGVPHPRGSSDHRRRAHGGSGEAIEEFLGEGEDGCRGAAAGD